MTNQLKSYITNLYGEQVFNELLDIEEDIIKGEMGRQSVADYLEVSRKKARNIINKVRKKEEVPEDEPDHTKKLSEWVTEEEYVFNGDDDMYIFMIPEHHKNLVLPGGKIRTLCRMYSNFNEGATVNECAMRLELPRNIIQGILRALGYTHDSEPFTPEEMKEKPTDELVSDYLQEKRWEFERSLNKKQWKETQKKAERFDKFKYSTLDAIEEWFSSVTIKKEIPKITPPNLSTATFPEQGAFIGNYDLHYAKRACDMLSGATWDRKTAQNLILEKFESLLDELAFYNVQKIYLPIGNDNWQVDTDHGTTTSGTNVDLDGSPQEMVWFGTELERQKIDTLRRVAEVELLHIPGNHDRLLTTSLYASMFEAFKDCDDVIIENDIKSIQFRKFGKTGIMGIHGDQINKTKSKQLPNIISSQMPTAKHKAIFSGHLHHEMTADLNGALLFQVPSLTARDKWEFDNLHIGSRRGIAAYIIDPDRGPRRYVIDNVD